MFAQLGSTDSITVKKMRKILHHSKVVRVLTMLNRLKAEEYFTQNTRSQYLGSNKLLCQILGQFKLFVPGNDVGLAPHLIFDGFWEFWLTKFFADHVKLGDTVIDVGANLGYYSVLSADLVGPGGRVIAVEPNPAIFALLADSMRVNGFDTRSELCNIALGGQEDAATLPFFVPNGEPKNGRFIGPKENIERLRQLGEISEVKTGTLDALGLERVDFIKIDVEGAEIAVLDQLAPLIARFEPVVVCEVNFGRGYGYNDIAKRLGRNGVLKYLDFYNKIHTLTAEMIQAQQVNDDWLVVANV
ncbi:MAG: FkbM family methyltransferase [Pseudomonadota bacterium]